MSDGDWITGNVTLRIGGEPLDLQMTVPAFPVKPHRMLPIFQQMANSFVDASVSAVETEGKKISCKAGCGACCRQPVPIAEAEVYQIAELVEAMPEPRRTVVRERFQRAADHFRSVGWFDKFLAEHHALGTKPRETATRDLNSVVMEYFYEGIPCPFLENESCSIHPDRPIACREYLVTSPADNCSDPTAQTVDRIELMIQPSKTVQHMSMTGRMAKEGTLTLVRALELAVEYPENYDERTGEEWMREFFTKLTGAAPPATAA